MFDWSSYRDRIDNGDDVWETSAEKQEKAEVKQQADILYQRLTEARTSEAQAHVASEKAAAVAKKQAAVAKKQAAVAKKQAAVEKKKATTAASVRFMQNENIYNFDASRFTKKVFTLEYKSKLNKEYLAKVEMQYKKISNYTPQPKIIKETTKTGKLTSSDKFKNQFLGVFGNIKNLDKPKTVYQWRGGTIQDPVTKKEQDVIWENVMQISVIAEDKNNYYYRLSDNTIQSVPKSQVQEGLPDLEEQKAKYMANTIKNHSNVATIADKISYNIGQGLMKTVSGSATKEQLPTGNKALDIASGMGGEILGFALPTGGGASIASNLEQIGSGTVAKMAQKAPSVISQNLTGGIGKAATRGAVEMGVFSAAQDHSQQSKTDAAKSILEDMIAGGIFVGTVYGTSKGLTKLVQVWKRVPSTAESNNLLKAAKDEYTNAIDDIAQRDVTNESEYKSLMEEANSKLLSDVEEIANRYENVPSEEVPFPTKATKITSGKVENVPSKPNDMNLQAFTGTEPLPEGVSNPNILKTKEHIISKSDVKSSKENWFSKMYKNVVDRNRPLDLLTRTGNINNKLATENPYKTANLASTYEGIAKSNIEQGIADKNGKIVGAGLADIMKKVPKNKVNELKDYMILLQAAHLAEFRPKVSQVYPKEWGITLADMNAKIAKYEAENPTFANLASSFTFYNTRLMQTQLVDSGLLSAEDAATIGLANPYYTPSKRAFSNVEMSKQGGASSGFVGQGNQIKGRTGSERQILDPMESMIQNTFNFAKAAKRNEVGQTLYKAVEKNPEKYKGLLEIVQKVDDPKFDIGKAVDEGDLTAFTDSINEGFEIKGVKDLSRPNIVRVRVNGENKFLQIHDSALLDNLTSFNNDQVNTFVEGIRSVTGAMKALTTGINPMFGLARNIWRDIVSGYVQSTTTSKVPVYSYAKYMGELVSAMIGTMGKTKGYKTYRSLGGGFFSSAVGTEKNLLKETVAKYAEKGLKSKAKQVAKAPINALEWLNNTIETMPRYAEYKRTLNKLQKSGVDEYTAKMEAIYNGQEVTVNFKRSGQVTKTADAFVPYLNAAVQGLDKVLRSVDPRNPKQLANVVTKGITSITIPALALYALNKDNKNYQQLSDYVKDNNFLIPIDKKGTFIKIPKPREFGVLFGSLPERIAKDYADQQPEAWKNFVDTIIQNFAPPNIITENITAPIVRNVMSPEGRTWRGTPVVNQGLLKQSPKNQYDENTSAIAKFIGEKLNFAPKKVDEIMGSYLGGVQQLGKPLTSSRTLNEKGVIKAAIEVLKKQVTADSKYNTDLADTFYTNMENANMRKADLNAAGKLKGKGETYVDSATFVLANVADQLTDLRKKQKAASTNEEKDKIQVKMNTLMQKANEDYRKNYLKKQKMSLIKRQKVFTRAE
jgi:hypothetical protein